MSKKEPVVAVAEGDGIGPEIMKATLNILQASGAKLQLVPVEVGEKVYLRGIQNGIDPKTWEALLHADAFLKAPITTPQGGGFKSINVTIRSLLGLYANVRPCVAYAPFVVTKHPKMDLVIIRENEEDLYVGLEYRQTADVVHARKVISRSGCERIIRYAFAYAIQYGRKKVTCFTKDNILKLSDGLFHQVFNEIGEEYPQIEKEHWIVDIGSAKLADDPALFDVIVLPNLYGDILSDVAAQLAGSVGLAGSANIGVHGAMFEAIHGSAPRRAGQNVANPSGLLMGAIMMLNHLGYPEEAARIHNGWLKTVEEGIHTYDVYQEGVSREKVGTQEFAQAVIARLGQKPEKLPTMHYSLEHTRPCLHAVNEFVHTPGLLCGVDLFMQHTDLKQLLSQLECLAAENLKLTSIYNRGAKVWPEGMLQTTCTDEWRCRFMAREGKTSYAHIAALMQEAAAVGLHVISTENLYQFNGQNAFS